MLRLFALILILACAGATPLVPAQSRRVRRAEPPQDGRADKSAPSEDGAKDESRDKAQGETKAGGGSGDEGDEGDDRAMTAKEVGVRAVVKSKPHPLYPPGARLYGVRGEVKLRIVLGADGRVRDEMDVLTGLPHGVTEEAIKAARLIKFEPARKDGRPVSQYVTVIYHFHLH